MKKRNLLFLLLITSFGITRAQVGINTTDPKSTVHILPTSTNNSTAEGIIAPNLTRGQLISKDSKYTTDQQGAIVYITSLDGTATTKTNNITSVGYYYFDGNLWRSFTNGAWNLTGNSLTTAGTNFIGTTDSKDLVVKTNNNERMRIDASGNVGIGRSPSTGYKLALQDNIYIEGSPRTNQFLTTYNLGRDGNSYGNMTDNKGICFTTVSSANSGNPLIAAITSGGTDLTTMSADRYLNFYVRTANDYSDAAMTIRSYSETDKRVGVGTFDPQATLHVVNVNSQDPLIVSNVKGVTDTPNSLDGANPSYLNLKISSNGVIRREMPKSPTQSALTDLATNASIAIGTASGGGGTTLQWVVSGSTTSNIILPEDGAYVFSFRLYGPFSGLSGTLSTGCTHYISAWKEGGNIPFDIAEIYIAAVGPSVSAVGTYSVNLSISGNANDKVYFKISRLGVSGVNLGWTLRSNPGNHADKTSMVYWKL